MSGRDHLPQEGSLLGADTGEERILVEGGRGRSKRTPARGIVGYDPKDRGGVEAASKALQDHLKLPQQPTLVHRDPGWFERFWSWCKGAFAAPEEHQA